MKERFEEKYMPEPNSGCWLWTAASFRHGYGVFNHPKTRFLEIRQDQREARIIAAKYGVQKSAINKVRRRATWGHV